MSMKYDESYFKGETICDFYVPPMMKRVWAGLLDMLMVVDNLCRAANLKYYMAYGTLLGAVRHKGYIPWDDDIDIWMFRDDMMKFIELAESILPKYGLEIITPYNDADYNNPVAGIFNGRQMDISKERLEKYYGCPFSMRIDLFPLDNLPDDQETVDFKCRLSDEAWQLADIWNKSVISEREKKRRFEALTGEIGYTPIDGVSYKQQLSMLCDMIMISDDIPDSEYVANVRLYHEHPRARFRREWFEKPVYLQFGQVSLPAPADYDSVLRTIYGDYTVMRKGGTVHDYPFYKEQMAELHRAIKKQGTEIPEIFRE